MFSLGLEDSFEVQVRPSRMYVLNKKVGHSSLAWVAFGGSGEATIVPGP